MIAQRVPSLNTDQLKPEAPPCCYTKSLKLLKKVLTPVRSGVEIGVVVLEVEVTFEDTLSLLQMTVSSFNSKMQARRSNRIAAWNAGNKGPFLFPAYFCEVNVMRNDMPIQRYQKSYRLGFSLIKQLFETSVQRNFDSTVTKTTLKC